MLSIIIPFYNEAESLPILIKKLLEVCGYLKTQYEIILVDDGSDDNPDILNSDKVKLITHRKRMGKGRSLLSGFKSSSGDTVVFMDADLQDDPDDLRKFLKKIDEGFDFVNGWRVKRYDSLSKTLPSFIFNNLILKFIFRSKFHDINCGYKVMKRSVLEEIPLYGDNYRFLPILAEKNGFKVTETAVNHSPRRFGRSKYGFLRIFFGLFDTLTTSFIYEFSEKPLHFFGPVGLIVFMIGFLVTLYLTIQRLFFNVLLYRRPSLLLGILLIIVGIQIILTGIVAELIVYLSKKSGKTNI